MRRESIDDFGDDETEVQSDADGEGQVVTRRGVRVAVARVAVAMMVLVRFVAVLVWHGCVLKRRGCIFQGRLLARRPLACMVTCPQRMRHLTLVAFTLILSLLLAPQARPGAG